MAPGAPGSAPVTWQRPKSTWTAASWAELPGWEQDPVQEWWPALWRGCVKPAAAWAPVCAEVRKLGPQWGTQVQDGFVRQWVQSRLQPWRVSSPDGRPSGLLTGYFEPLLDGRRVTTHWFHARDLQKQFPQARVEEDRIFIIDGPVWTSAGVTTGIELALALVDDDLGRDVAMDIARTLALPWLGGAGDALVGRLQGRHQGLRAAGELGLLQGQAQGGLQVLHEVVVARAREREHQLFELGALQADLGQPHLGHRIQHGYDQNLISIRHAEATPRHPVALTDPAQTIFVAAKIGVGNGPGLEQRIDPVARNNHRRRKILCNNLHHKKVRIRLWRAPARLTS